MTKSEIFLVALSGLLAGVLLGVIILNIINEFSSSAWFCKRFGWHENPHEIGFDGLSSTGKCPRCGKDVLMDSNGDWF